MKAAHVASSAMRALTFMGAFALDGSVSSGPPHNGTLVRVGTRMTIEEIAILSVLIAVVVVSVWLGFLRREF
jgi:hypothetical protein